MKRIVWIAVAVGSALACAPPEKAPARTTSGSTTYYAAGSIVGVVNVGEGVSAYCEDVQVDTFAEGKLVGRRSIHGVEGRCQYEIADIPPNKEITVSVQPEKALSCSDGRTVKVAPEQQTVTLKERESKLVDFTVTCE
jgi:hypothetical protein